jgi:hypothetical protein
MSRLSDRLIPAKHKPSLGEYGVAVLKHWQWLMVAVVLFAVGGIQVVVTTLVLPWWLWIVLALLALVVAQYLAFFDVRCERDQALAHVEELTKEAAFPDIGVQLLEAAIEREPNDRYGTLRAKLEIVNRAREDVTLRCWFEIHNEQDTVSNAWKQREAPIVVPARQVVRASFNVTADSEALRPYLKEGSALPHPRFVRIRAQELLSATERSFDVTSGDPASPLAMFEKRIGKA